VYLKKIEFQGFKSFVDPTTLAFEPGISAIIGPNGCGKSNVSDAIRWVLGEQSAKALRGSKMVDVIFNGTDTRKPSGMAEVSLTISNEDRVLPVDFAEVTVTRRSFRSGETEYLINKSPARLKDIYALFADTGIGTDGYSLLEQGKMDLILSSKPMERRSVFEEAAGITRYKTQRDESLRKLDATDQNLLRVNDIVTEVKRQIGSLERQARKAEKYQVLKTELDQLASRLLIKQVKDGRSEWRSLEEGLAKAKDALDALDAGMKAQDAAAAHLRLELLKDEDALALANQALYALESQAAQVDRQQELNKQQIANLDERASRAAADAVDLRAREQQVRQELQANEDERSREQGILQDLKSQLLEAERLMREVSQKRQGRSDHATAVQQKLIQFIDQRSAVRGEMEALQGKLGMVDVRVQQLEQELGTAQSSLQDASRKLEEAATQAGEKGQEVKSLEDTLGNQYLRKRELEEAVRASEEGINNRQVMLGSEKARLGVIEELSKALEGYEAGPKALLQGKQKGEQAAAGLASLAHIVKAKPEAEAAVELALGKRLQALLCQDDAQAIAALEWLRQGKHGRAALIPSQSLRPPQLDFDGALLSSDGVLGPLTAFLEVPAGQEGVLRWLAGHLLLVRDLQVAQAVAPRLPQGGEAVTLDGWLLGSTGVLEGGASETAERGLLSREREMLALRANIEDGLRQVTAMQADRERLRGELSSLSSEIDAHASKMKDAEIQVVRLQKEQGARQDDVERLAKESSTKREAIETVQVEAAGFRGRLETLERQAAEMGLQEQTLQGDLNAVLDEISGLRKAEEEHVATVNSRRVGQASADQRLQNLGVTIERLRTETAQAAEQAQRREAEEKSARQEQEALSAKNSALETQLKSLFLEKDAAQEKVRISGEARSERQGAIASAEDAIRRLRADISAASEARHHQDLQAQQLRLRLDSLEQTLAQDYHVDLETLDQNQLFVTVEGSEGAEAQAEPDPARVEELKKKLDELGVVNPAAAEEYRELEQRHSLLVGQLEDLRSAKADLLKVIHRINQESRERFLATFEKVHESFKRTFRTLFGGGEGKLVLQEEGDLLEAGIDIIARPPGKRQQSISLLSGGEKALTATALLFALFETKPSPFCVLDEIDAPLDDTNITRFSALLSEYAGKSQFIVITHSKLTMEKADVLYGVTMEEAGVSKIISAKFRDEKAVKA
jgi:chromosome segregation protein